ncbi:peptidoglycan editing factor PgeF [Alkalibacter mobilis]|uniref:peptidoglycan editing factor PgeF n=1 Tax=Alkalibacter mobilis TaxID=2787712 RepID=UPI00189CC28E|nr:peptidoglycan editing factor PgeF [Alkalibacter mobilis]MBF7097682.1 peptidoglycan editing factor PgeF [Alkalibacter mobilis]
MSMKTNIYENFEFFTFDSFEQSGLVKHCFTSRIGGTSKPPFDSMDLNIREKSYRNDIKSNFEILARALDTKLKNFTSSDQIHKDIIWNVKEKDKGKGILFPSDIEEVDGLITNQKYIALITYYADCVPLFILDPVKKAIGLSHAGWRGTVKGIGIKTLDKMKDEFDTDPADCLIGIGPSIGECCFEVGLDVVDEIRNKFDNWEKYCKIKSEDKYHVDLWNLNKDQFMGSGVKEENITISEMCTKCLGEKFYSYRRDGHPTGRMAAVMMLI